MGPVARLGLALAVLAGLWVLAGVALLEQTQARHEMRLADVIAATRALLGETQQALLREARFLASDPAVVEGVVKGDWATLARGASPRILSVTSDRIGDLLVGGVGVLADQSPEIEPVFFRRKLHHPNNLTVQ